MLLLNIWKSSWNHSMWKWALKQTDIDRFPEGIGYTNTLWITNLTRNVLDCDQSNYSSRIIFSYAFTLEPNTNWIGWTVSEIWPFKIIQDGWRPRCWIWSIRKYRDIRSADLENPKLTVEPKMKCIGWSVPEIWPFEIFQNARSVGRCCCCFLKITMMMMMMTTTTMMMKFNVRPLLD